VRRQHDDIGAGQRPSRPPRAAALPGLLDPVHPGTRRQRYCTDACRKTAWTRRHATTPTETLAPQAIRRRDTTLISEYRHPSAPLLGEANNEAARKPGAFTIT